MFVRNLFVIPIALMLSLSLIVVSCDDNSVGSEDKTGTMEVQMHDAPADYEEVNVYVESVRVNNADSDTGWVTINSPQQSYDLLKLSNGASVVLGSEELSTGTYNQIRLVLSRDDHSVVLDGTEHDMMVPSGSQTGIKLNINAEIKEDITYTLVLDFDAARSIVERPSGQSGSSYLLKPVVRAYSQAETGNIAGSVSPADAHPFVYAIANSDTLSSTKADTTSGDFKLIGLEEGSYTVSVDPTNGTYQSADTSNVSVTLDETNDIGTVTVE